MFQVEKIILIGGCWKRVVQLPESKRNECLNCGADFRPTVGHRSYCKYTCAKAKFNYLRRIVKDPATIEAYKRESSRRRSNREYASNTLVKKKTYSRKYYADKRQKILARDWNRRWRHRPIELLIYQLKKAVKQKDTEAVLRIRKSIRDIKGSLNKSPV